MLGPTMLSIVLIAGLLGTIGLGGGLYETLLIDRAWPGMPKMVQPGHGGINRKFFWGPIHGLFELALIISIWLTWSEPGIRPWIWAAFASHMIARVWSFAYFIPAAMRFETASADDPKTGIKAARKWVRLSRWRLPLELLSVAFLLIPIVQSMQGG